MDVIEEIHGATGAILLQRASLRQFGPSHDGSVERDLAYAEQRLEDAIVRYEVENH